MFVDPRQQIICVLGSGPAGLITAHTLIQDGFEYVRVITRDSTPGGVWAIERVYPGLTLNNVHGEYRFSPLPMASPSDGKDTGDRLRGKDLRDYFQEFARRFLDGRIQYNREVWGIRREVLAEGHRWQVTTHDTKTNEMEDLYFDKIVLCTGGCSEPKVPLSLSEQAARQAGSSIPVVHSSEIAPELSVLLGAVKPLADPDPGHILVIGGGKSAQDAAAFFARNGRKVSMVFEYTDAIVAAPVIPLPDFIRKSRFLAVLSPSIQLRTRLEQFLHNTWLGTKITHGFWDFLGWCSFAALGVPPSSPLRKTHSLFWGIRTNDEGVGGPNRFHSLVKAGRINLIAPSRATRYHCENTSDGDDGATTDTATTITVEISNGQRISANAVILATGYKSSWSNLFDEETRKAVGLHAASVPHTEEFDYCSLANPPSRHNDKRSEHCLIYRGMVPAASIYNRDFAINGASFTTNPGYAFEVSAHWISSYFLEDPFLRLPPSVKDTMKECEKYNAWLRKRYPDMLAEINESYSSTLPFWSWPQEMDELLEDMRLRSMRSGGNWLTWPFKVIDLKEIENLHEERAQSRLSAGTANLNLD